ncbi:MAG: long-chain fatty acid--CoA ligase [Microbacterium sp.]|uniref:acyl-CoA synthetase n=1 Tax=Microbacterium sp. TaxID=51671 RepID=UPI001AC42AD2|nr:long-chain fatty acid--CoA ligase [Microbacterium sp.]MBN9176402.1 long-chain fatty acid--CoA ligase [Microbacterium sp.]
MDNQGLGTWISRRRVKSEGDVAVVHGDTAVRYEEFAARIDLLAGALAERGVRKGDRVVYLGNNHPDFLTTFFACGLRGAIFVPLNTRLAPRELEYMIDDCGARVLILHEEQRALARAAAWSSGIEHRIVVEGAPEAPAVEALDEVLAAASVPGDDVPVSLDDPAMILYTSGTTGRPKGAVLTHGNLTWNALNVLVDYDVTSDERALLIAPMFHVASLGMGALPTLLKGGTLVLQQKVDPGAVLAAIAEHRITSLSGVPTTFQLLAEHPAWEATDLSSLRKLTCGGSAVPSRVSEAYEARGLHFSSGFGMTETSPGATSLPYRKAHDHPGSSGLAHFFTDVRVVGPDGAELPAGKAGEIEISGPNVMKEYWLRPDATRDAHRGTWFRSGDIGHLDAQGYLVISDRLKDMIISGGENVYPAEIEQIIMENAAIDAVAVIGIPDERWGEVPLAVVALRPGELLAPEEILAPLDGRLAKYKVPRGVVFVDELPRTASGKIRKNELRTQYQELPEGSRPTNAASTPALPTQVVRTPRAR